MFGENWRNIQGLTHTEEPKFTEAELLRLEEMKRKRRIDHPEERESAVTFQSEKLLRILIQQEKAYANAASSSKGRTTAEIRRDELAAQAAAEAERTRLYEANLQRQRNEQAAAAADVALRLAETKKRLDEFQRWQNGELPPTPAPTAEEVAALKAKEAAAEANLAKLRAERTAPDRMSTCPVCRNAVRLVDGKLPASHTIQKYDPAYGTYAPAECNPYATGYRF